MQLRGSRHEQLLEHRIRAARAGPDASPIPTVPSAPAPDAGRRKRAAHVGALAARSAQMVAGLTVGRPKYARGRRAQCGNRPPRCIRTRSRRWPRSVDTRCGRVRCGGRRVQDAQGARGAAEARRAPSPRRIWAPQSGPARDRAGLCRESPSSQRSRPANGNPNAVVRCRRRCAAGRRRPLAAPPTTCGSTSRRWATRRAARRSPTKPQRLVGRPGRPRERLSRNGDGARGRKSRH